jgi:hypothetical protein
MNSRTNTERHSDPAPDAAALEATTSVAHDAGGPRLRVAWMAEMPAGKDHANVPPTRPHPREVLWLLGRLFPPGRVIDTVTTRAAFAAPPDEVWQTMMFYEEVPHRPPLLLRMFLPTPVKTQGSDKQVGTRVECTYSRGGLVKRITVLERPRLVRFEVLEQHLGVERCLTTVEGSYEFRADGQGTEVALTTRYRGHLRPRWLWRPLERLLAHQLHRHILAGMGAARAGGGAAR